MAEERRERLGGVAVKAARLFGDQLREVFDTGVRDVEFKRDFHDTVTMHDRMAEKAIRSYILSEEPDSFICGEEGGEEGVGSTQWYVDPIDGTVNFVHGLSFFCISIGVVDQGQLVAGAVYDPVREELYTAVAGRGATLNGSPITSVGARNDAEAMVITSVPTSVDLEGDRAAETLERFGSMVRNFRVVRRTGSAALTLCHIAVGRGDVCYGNSVHAWDVAAGMLIVQEAGGQYVAIAPTDVATPWNAPGYVAAVGNFDFESSCIGDLARGERGVRL